MWGLVRITPFLSDNCVQAFNNKADAHSLDDDTYVHSLSAHRAEADNWLHSQAGHDVSVKFISPFRSNSS